MLRDISGQYSQFIFFCIYFFKKSIEAVKLHIEATLSIKQANATKSAGFCPMFKFPVHLDG